MTQFFGIRTSHAFLALMASTLLLAGCGGESTEQLPNTTSNDARAQYNGPAAETNDVLSFKENIWDNLATQDKCGACHNDGGQSPQFVHENNINTAYAQANTIVNLADPSQSEMVTKVAGGHNCWESSTSACVDLLTTWIANWAGGSEGSAKTVELRAPDIKDAGATLKFPETTGLFGQTIYPVLTENCSECHTSGNQTPFLAADIGIAYEQAKSRIDLNDGRIDPETGNQILANDASSRLVERLWDDNHNCWAETEGGAGDCAYSSTEMLEAIQAFIAGLDEPSELPEEFVASKALNLETDGLLANSGGRFEDNVIALYEFKAGEGQTAFDTSGVSPALNMTLSGNVGWVGGWGVEFGPATENEEGQMIRAGKAQGSTDDSRKLHTLLTAANQYSLEAWVVPGNVVQEDARIVTYSGSSTTRNLTLGQNEQMYEVLHRSTTSDENTPFATESNPMLLQATLQHVVVNYSPDTGRQIFVNGQPTGDADPDAPGLLTDWDDTFALVFGNETDGNSPWQGALRMVAIHSRVLTPEQIQANYDVGVGQKFFLLFSVSHLIDGMDESFIVFEVSQFDSFGYLFSNPFYIDLDESASPSNVPLKGMRIGINGREPAVGQAFANLDVTLGSDYTPGSGQPLSSLGTVIGLEQGPGSDEFFLTFEQLGSNQDVRTEGNLPAQPAPSDLDPVSVIGLKTFEEINASMSKMTGIPVTNEAVASTYNTVRQQLPTVPDIKGFLASHQMGITQLAIQYCDALVEDPTARDAFFSPVSVDFNADVATAFNTTNRPAVIDPLLENLVGNNLADQPTNAAVEAELNSLIDTLTACPEGCDASRTKTVVKASCAAVLGSAVTLIQ